eukprot:TRINITY_DN422_c0_g2_i1.p1 TRINITY_DN422_c0_g2~~TRINITY_DN422_c0_g2_i1.p1  ORF type:complete len:100 (+),score=12.88 TRINITY_DN422_c0_g2_i1:46-300(+)
MASRVHETAELPTESTGDRMVLARGMCQVRQQCEQTPPCAGVYANFAPVAPDPINEKDTCMESESGRMVQARLCPKSRTEKHEE